MLYRITVLPQHLQINAPAGASLLSVLREAGLIPEAPCGGQGHCGKCKVTVDQKEVLACRTSVDRDMTVMLPHQQTRQILTDGISPAQATAPADSEYALAFDIGTTTVVGYLLHGQKTLACASAGNPQAAYGADVISRIRLSLQGQREAMRVAIRGCLEALTHRMCRRSGILPGRIQIVSIVGNPAMQQLFLGMSLENLAKVPFAPVLTRAQILPAGKILPLWENARLQIIPNIAGFVGADTVACIMATEMDTADELTLLVDIGTNGEMVLGNRHHLVACSAAAGPALEGAAIQFGMGGQDGAIDHVWLEQGQIRCSVLGGGSTRGICGSGLIDAVAVALDTGWLNARGKILTADGLIHLTPEIYLTQEDIRQLQLAKGAIAAGIELMVARMGIELREIQRVFLAGAFGTYMDARSACRIGLLPSCLENRITAVGNAAGSGAKLLCAGGLDRAQEIAECTEALELSEMRDFARCFAKNMRF